MSQLNVSAGLEGVDGASLVCLSADLCVPGGDSRSGSLAIAATPLVALEDVDPNRTVPAVQHGLAGRRPEPLEPGTGRYCPIPACPCNRVVDCLVAVRRTNVEDRKSTRLNSSHI